MAAALTALSLVIVIGVGVWALSLALAFFTYFSGVFLPLAFAGILATLLKPYYAWIAKSSGSNVLAIIVVFISIFVPIGLLIFYFGSVLLKQLSDLLNALPVWVGHAQAYVQERLPAIRSVIEKYDLRQRLSALLEGRTEFLAGSAVAVGRGMVSTGSAVFQTITGMLAWVVLPIYFVFMIQAPRFTAANLESHLPFLKPATRRDVVYLITEFASIIVAFFRGQFVVAFCQGLLFAVGFSFAGLAHGFVIGLLLGFLNIIPYLGNIVGLAIVIPLAWFQAGGGAQLLAGVGVVFVIVQCIEGYLLTPRIMGKTTGLHPMAIIFAILFWGTALNGLLGMVLAIPLTAFLVVFWRLLRTHYITEWI